MPKCTVAKNGNLCLRGEGWRHSTSETGPAPAQIKGIPHQNSNRNKSS